jgi:hypothetical protein
MTKKPRQRRPPGLSRALGLTNTSRRSSRSLATVSHEALRRASPAENVRMGFSPTARRYVKRSVKVTKATASISARQAETKRTSERYGFKTPEAATRARREGGLGYESRAQGERVAKAEQTRLFKRIDAAANAREKIPYDPLGKRNVKRQRWLALKPGDKERYRDLRARRLRGEWFDDIADFTWLMDMSKRFGDRDATRLRGSPDGRLPGEHDFDEDDYDEGEAA